MDLQDLKKLNLPDEPGVYYFTRQNFSKKNLGGLKQRKVFLYIGKATSLRDRVKSYFSKDLIVGRGPRIVTMVELADGVEFTKTDSALEALILEAHEIKKYQPKYNAREKDNKSFNYVVITKDDFPKVEVVRGRTLIEDESTKNIGVTHLSVVRGASEACDQVVHNGTVQKQTSEVTKKCIKSVTPIKYSFGPFPYGSELREAMKIIRKILPYSDSKCKTLLGKPAKVLGGKISAGKPCFNAQIGLCPGVCTGAITKIEYAQTIKNLKKLFEGKKKDLIKDLERQMKLLASKQEFEKANLIKRKIFALTHIQDVALIKHRAKEGQTSMFRIEAYDIAHLSGKDTVGVMTVVLDGEADKSSYRRFTIRGSRIKDKIPVFIGMTMRRLGEEVQINDVANLKEILSRRFSHDEWPLPQLIVLDGGKAQLNAAQNILNVFNLDIPIVSVVKDEYHHPREILGNRKIISKWEREIILANSEAHRFAIHFHRQIRGRVI